MSTDRQNISTHWWSSSKGKPEHLHLHWWSGWGVAALSKAPRFQNEGRSTAWAPRGLLVLPTLRAFTSTDSWGWTRSVPVTLPHPLPKPHNNPSWHLQESSPFRKERQSQRECPQLTRGCLQLTRALPLPLEFQSTQIRLGGPPQSLCPVSVPAHGYGLSFLCFVLFFKSFFFLN